MTTVFNEKSGIEIIDYASKYRIKPYKNSNEGTPFLAGTMMVRQNKAKKEVYLLQFWNTGSLAEIHIYRMDDDYFNQGSNKIGWTNSAKLVDDGPATINYDPEGNIESVHKAIINNDGSRTYEEITNLNEKPSIEEISQHIDERGNLNLCNNSIVKELPNDFKIEGYLALSFSAVKELPKGLEVGGDLDLTCTEIYHLPKDAKIKGRVIYSVDAIKIIRWCEKKGYIVNELTEDQLVIRKLEIGV